MDQYRVLRDGVSLEIKTGDTVSRQGSTVTNTTGTIASQGKVYSASQLPDHIIKAYEDGDEHVRSLIEKVDEEGAPVGGPSPDDHEALVANYEEAHQRIESLEEEKQALLDESQRKDDELTQVRADLAAVTENEDEEKQQLRARVEELEAQLEEATAPSGDAPEEDDQFAQLDEEGLKEAGKQANYPKLGETNWSELSDDEKREALRQAAASGGDGQGQ